MRDLAILLAAAGVVVAAGYYMNRRNGGAGLSLSPTVRVSGSPDQIIGGALPGQPGWGWQYFTDGTAISPEGIYYLNGREVWRP